jgi:hypothetical protein
LIVANPQEPIVGVPIVVPPIEVEVPLRVVLVEVRDVAVAIDLSNGSLCNKPSITLLPDRFAKAESNL